MDDGTEGPQAGCCSAQHAGLHSPFSISMCPCAHLVLVPIPSASRKRWPEYLNIKGDGMGTTMGGERTVGEVGETVGDHKRSGELPLLA